MTTQNVNALSPVGYLNTVTGHLWSLTEQPEAIMRSGLYEPLVLSREALKIAQQKDALQLSVDNILRGLGITGDGSVTQLVLEKFIALQAKCDAWASKSNDLVTENIALKHFIFGSCVIPSGIDGYESAARRMPETPATDAAIAEIKAQGLDELANKLDGLPFNCGVNHQYVVSFAANLRAGRKG